MCIRDSTYSRAWSDTEHPIEAKKSIRFLRASINEANELTLIPVSYTHLDVYKRQDTYNKDKWGEQNEENVYYREKHRRIQENTYKGRKGQAYCCLLYTSRCV